MKPIVLKLLVGICLIIIAMGCDDGGSNNGRVENDLGEPKGRLNVIGHQLSNSLGQPVQLKGLSVQGLQWFPWGTCITSASLDWLADDDNGFGINIFRIPCFIEMGGYESDPAGMVEQTKKMVDEVTRRGMYALIDWHVLGFNPNKYLDEAKAFWQDISATYAGREDVIFEICNEPKAEWTEIKRYAETIIPIIRANDPEVIVLVGTPNWSFELSGPANDPLSQENAHNVMYVMHVYTASPAAAAFRSKMDPYLGTLPVFVSEWGASYYTGDIPDNYDMANEFIDYMDGGNSAGVNISWIAWSFTDDNESSAMIKVGRCPDGPWDTTSLKESGLFFWDKLRTPAQ